MNILVLTSVYPQPDDGETSATYTVQYFCQEWVKQGHKVLVVQNSSRFPKPFYLFPKKYEKKLASKLGFNVPKKESIKKIKRVENGVTIYREPMKKIIPHSHFSNSVIKSQVKKINNIIKENSFVPDLIISHWANPQLQIIKELKQYYNVKTSIVFHNDCTPKNIKQLNMKDCLKYIDAIGCRSKKNSQEVMKLLNLHKLPFVCYSGVPDYIAKKHENTVPKKEKNSFVYVGRLVEYKNVDKILLALANAFPKKNFKFRILGTGGEFDNLKKLTSKLGIEKQVDFVGQVNRDEVFKILEKSETFVMISDNETFGMVYIEAMAMGCITIASIDGGVDGVIKHNYNGFLTTQGNAEELAKLLSNIYKCKDKDIKLIRKNAINTAIEFADSNISKKYLKDIEEW